MLHGNLGKKRTPEQREAMRLRALGRRHSPETKAKIGAAARGRRLSPETRRLLSVAATGRPNPGAADTARRADVRAANAAAHRGRLQSPEHIEKRVSQLRGKPQPAWLIARRTAPRPTKKRTAAAKARQRAAMLGRTLTPEHREKLRRATQEQYVLGKRQPHFFPAKAVEYLDRNGRLWKFRSSWERDVATQLDGLATRWAYEPHRLLLSDGTVYVPDFWLVDDGFYVEVKGQKRFARKAELAMADGHAVELLLANDVFASVTLVQRLALTAKGRP